MDDASLAGTVIFDGSCGFCTRIVRIASALSLRENYEYLAFQKLTKEDKSRYCLRDDRLSKAVHIVMKDGSVFSGARACNRFLWSTKGWFWRAAIAFVRVIWPLLLLERSIYWLIARNRETISHILGTSGFALRCKIGEF
jgi:predicted DCC family thiol-disulfide oxidoreductase YuxK